MGVYAASCVWFLGCVAPFGGDTTFSFPFLFFSSLSWNGSFFFFLSFLGFVIPFFAIFSSFPSFHLSKTVPGFLMGLNLTILKRVLNGNLSKPVLCHSTNRSSQFLKSLLIFLQPIFLVIRKNGSQERPQYSKVISWLAFSKVLELSTKSA